MASENLTALQTLEQEQLMAGHIVESNSPWNIPVFVIKKKSEKWRLLQDLCAVNAIWTSDTRSHPSRVF